MSTCSKPTLSRSASACGLFYAWLTRSFFLAWIDSVLWNKSPHGQSHLRSPPDPRHLPRSPSLPNTNNIHRRFPFLAVHVTHPPACPSRAHNLPAAISVNRSSEPGWSTHIPRAARRDSSATATGQDQGNGPTPLAADRDGLETRTAGEHCSPSDDWQLRRQEACDGSAGTRAENADERKDGEEAQQSRATSVGLCCRLVRPKFPIVLGTYVCTYEKHGPLWYTQNCTFHIYRTDCMQYRVNPKSSRRQLVLLPLDILRV